MNTLNKNMVYIVSTPIGNLGDISYRAIEVLKSVDIILCEDTRHSIKLLNHYNIKNKLISYHKFNEEKRIEFILESINDGKSLALISDAGTPLLSDPGEVLISKLKENNISYTVIPGANALLPALILSGFDMKEFTFIGFLDKKSTKREEKLKSVLKEKRTIVLYSSPHELFKVLLSIDEIFSDRKVCLVKEITKVYESVMSAPAKELISLLEDKSIKGEYVLLIEGYKETTEEISFDKIKEMYFEGIKKDKPKDVIKELSKKYNLNKRELYSKLVKEKEDS